MVSRSKSFAEPLNFITASVARFRCYDAVIIFTLAGLAIVGLEYLDVANRALAFAAAHERWELADSWLVVSLFGTAAIAVAYRRNQRLQGENTERKAAEQDAWNLARHDALTGLPNQRYFSELVSAALRCVNDSETRAAVLMFDLTGFKAVNEIYGRHTGDQALTEIAEGISAILDPGTIFDRRR